MTTETTKKWSASKKKKRKDDLMTYDLINNWLIASEEVVMIRLSTCICLLSKGRKKQAISSRLNACFFISYKSKLVGIYYSIKMCQVPMYMLACRDPTVRDQDLDRDRDLRVRDRDQKVETKTETIIV